MEQITEPTTEQSIEIDAPAEAVWQLVSDPTRIPEWSPVCHRCEWSGSDRVAAVGARFRGYNRLNGARWSRECEVTVVDPGAVFAFSTVFRGQESTRWRYRLESAGSTTTVREAYQIVMIPPWVRALRRLPGMNAKSNSDTQRNIEQSLGRLKALAEGAAAR